MNAQAIIEDFISYEQYAAAESKAAERHEWWQGRIYAMAGGSPTHAQLGFNVTVAIGRQLQGKRCRGASGDQRIRIEATGLATYPDAVVFCPPARFDAEDAQALVNPSLIVEVLSPSTESYDRGDKWAHYSQIGELRDYLLVSQNRVQVEHFQRDEADASVWHLRRYSQREDVLQLPNLDIAVALTEIYEGIDVPAGITLWHE